MMVPFLKITLQFDIAKSEEIAMASLPAMATRIGEQGLSCSQGLTFGS